MVGKPYWSKEANRWLCRGYSEERGTCGFCGDAGSACNRNKAEHERAVAVPEPTLHEVKMILCSLCLDGAGGECHTPGCTLWINRSPDLVIRDHPCMLEIDGARVHAGIPSDAP